MFGMYKGIYIALSGAVLKQKHMEVITQNIANGNTVGYKKSNISFQNYLMPKDAASPAEDERVMSNMSSLKVDFSEGNVIFTGNPLDIALDGEGFIALEGNLYTRRGDLQIDGEGNLTNHSGFKVLGNGGPISLSDEEGTIQISDDGIVSVNGVEIDTINIVSFPQKESLSNLNEGMFFSTDNPEEGTAKVKQGYLENSNVDIITEMFQMIKTMREFETYQKAIQTFDEASAKVNNEIARV